MTQLANYSTENFRSFSMSNLVTMPTMGDNRKLPISYTLTINDQDEDSRKLKLFQKYKSLEDVRKVDFYQYLKEKISLDKRAYTPEFRSFSSKSCINYDETLTDDTFLRSKGRTPSPYDFNIVEPFKSVTSMSHIIPEETRVVSSPLVSTIIEESEYSSKTKNSRSPSECTLHSRYSCDELDCSTSTHNQNVMGEILWDKACNLTDLNSQQGGLEPSHTPINSHYNKKPTKDHHHDAKIRPKNEETRKQENFELTPKKLKTLSPKRNIHSDQNPVSKQKSLPLPKNAVAMGCEELINLSKDSKRSLKNVALSASDVKEITAKAHPSSSTPKKQKNDIQKSDVKKESTQEKTLKSAPEAKSQAITKGNRRRNLSFSSRTTSKSGSINAKLTKSPKLVVKQEIKKQVKTKYDPKLSQKLKPLPRSKSSGSDILKKRLDTKLHFSSPITQIKNVAKNEKETKSTKVDIHHLPSRNVHLYYPEQPPVMSIKECLNFEQEKISIIGEKKLEEGPNIPNFHNDDIPKYNFNASEGVLISNETMCDVLNPSSNLSESYTDIGHRSIKEKRSKDHIIELIRRMSNNVMKKPTEYIMSLYKTNMDSPSKVQKEYTVNNNKVNDEQQRVLDEPVNLKNSSEPDKGNKSEYKISFVATRPKTSANDDKKLFDFIKRKLKVDHIKAQYDGSAIETDPITLKNEVDETAKSSDDHNYSDVNDTGSKFCSLHIPCFPERRSLKYSRAPIRSNGQAASYKKIKEKLSKDHLMSPTRLMTSIKNGEVKTEYQKSYGMVPDNDFFIAPKVSRALYMQNREKALLDHIKILYCENDTADRCSGQLENVSSKSKSENNISEYKSSFLNIDNLPKRPYKTPSSAILFP